MRIFALFLLLLPTTSMALKDADNLDHDVNGSYKSAQNALDVSVIEGSLLPADDDGNPQDRDFYRIRGASQVGLRNKSQLWLEIYGPATCIDANVFELVAVPGKGLYPHKVDRMNWPESTPDKATVLASMFGSEYILALSNTCSSHVSYKVDLTRDPVSVPCRLPALAAEVQPQGGHVGRKGFFKKAEDFISSLDVCCCFHVPLRLL